MTVTVTDPILVNGDQKRYNSVYHSHSGVDLLVLNIFELLGILHTATYLDIGAHHPIVISNTGLLYERGLRGVNVEANPNLMQAFFRLRPEDLNINAGVATESGEMDFYMIDSWSGRNTFSKKALEAFVQDFPAHSITQVQKIRVLTLNDLVDTYCDYKFPDFLSLDIEQFDYDVLRTADFGETHPRIVCVETVNSDGTQSYQAFRDMMLGKGFVTYCRTIADTIFIRREDAQSLDIL